MVLTASAKVLLGLMVANGMNPHAIDEWEGRSMTHTRSLRVLVVSAFTAILGLVLVAPTATASAGNRPSPLSAASGAVAAPAAPANLRVTQLTPTSVTFQWDHPQPWPQGCTLRIFQYSVYLDGRFYGYTYLGSPVGLVSRLRPGSTHELAVQARDNCSGLWSPRSRPLPVTTPTA
jgi:hypothetical protein